MDRIARKKRYLTQLFSGPFPGHALIYNPPGPGGGERLGDYAVSDRPVEDWVPFYVRDYENRVRAMEALDDDGVPYVNLCSYTGIFAAAFGCPTHVYEGMSTNPMARPIVHSGEDADRLPEPSLDSPGLTRFFRLAELLARELGPDVPISVPDIQSPFGIAAIVWEKQSLFLHMATDPEPVKRLVGKCHRLLQNFLLTFRNRFPQQANLCHCPYTWAPPELGCWLSEDEVGAFSLAMFEEFCLPSLTALSEALGGMFIHCCAHARHQYDGFLRVPNLRGLNPSFRRVPPADCVRMFSGRAVIMMGYTPEEQLNELLDLAGDDTRYLFNLDAMPLETARPLYERLRTRCPRVA